MHLFVSGRVQGVGYRWHTKQESDRLGVTGWVRNLEDGRVEAIAQGARNALDALVAWCRKGPAHAGVTDVAATWDETEDVLADFSVKR